MGTTYDELRELEEQRRTLRNKISKVSGLISELQSEQSKIVEAHNTMYMNVVMPVGHPVYDLSEGEKWRGLNYNAAVEQLNGVVSDIDTYSNDVSEVVGQIGTAIERLEEVLDDLNGQLAALG